MNRRRDTFFYARGQKVNSNQKRVYQSRSLLAAETDTESGAKKTGLSAPYRAVATQYS